MLDRAIQYAVAVSRYGSFTAAAERVGVTQSAITKSISELERRLGYAVFNRTARGIVPTEEGRAFIDRAARLLDDLNALMRTSRRKDPYAGELRIGICPASLEPQVIKPIAELLRRHPQILVDVSSASFDRMVQQLRNGSVDVVLGFESAFNEQTDLRRTELGPLRTAYFVRLDHPLVGQKRVTEQDLARFDFVTSSTSRPYAPDVRSIFEGHGIDAASRIHTIDYFPLVRKIISQSNAVGVVSLDYAQSQAFSEQFALLDLEQPITPSRLCCAVRSRWETSPAVRAFIRSCREPLPS